MLRGRRNIFLDQSDGLAVAGVVQRCCQTGCKGAA